MAVSYTHLSPDESNALNNKIAHEHTLEYLKDMYKKQTEGTSTTEEGSTKADEKTALQAAFDIYLDTKMRACLLYTSRCV